MIVVKKNNYLEYKNLKFRCALGKGGIQKKIKEGDKITPKGTYKILSIYYREDRIKKIKCSIRKIKITKQMGWCDDSKSKYYNKQIKIPTKLRNKYQKTEGCIALKKNHLKKLLSIIKKSTKIKIG